ncbi:hypothetical protein H696_01952 [Fonticula alba]|uniref:Transcription initiation factor TFIID subunit 10 n=1 Tax=Fonticula alba TaxID=691883 RepID=A0A058ZC43_FONAL|nr:hypothetical protein H696_01952 [Fonticula alba]KCV71007.1 hypothetical protein H696_01952 [Fonticula alba]|eukprot:XP_009494130.1 hypothetical protein H696_01952 [Fonticula alba]
MPNAGNKRQSDGQAPGSPDEKRQRVDLSDDASDDFEDDFEDVSSASRSAALAAANPPPPVAAAPAEATNPATGSSDEADGDAGSDADGVPEADLDGSDEFEDFDEEEFEDVVPGSHHGGPVPKIVDFDDLSRAEQELTMREQSLPEFYMSLRDTPTVIPDAITTYYMQRAGFECSDVRMKRLISLAAQKFLTDLARDAFSHSLLRLQGEEARMMAETKRRARKQDRKHVLTVDDLSAALSEEGVRLRRPEHLI